MLTSASTIALAILLLASSPAGAGEIDVKPAPPESKGSFLEDNPITRGHVLFDARLRYELVSQSGVSNANAATARIRLGYQTDWWHGFALLLEAEATGGINQPHNYTVPGLTDNPTDKAVVVDPNNAEINRANLQYQNEEWGVHANLYRQRIILGNSRFVGNVGWRQNEQTFDAARIDLAPRWLVEDASLFYAYVWQTNRIFGLWSGRDVSGNAAGKWISGSHLLNASYFGLPFAAITAYYYGFDDESPDPLATNSSNVGFYATHDFEIGESTSLGYYAEYDYQRSAFGNPSDWAANYFHLMGMGSWGDYHAGAAFESLGADDGLAVQFPYGTNHKFNGRVDLFLTTPTFGITGGRAAGLQDLYFTLGAKLPLGVSGEAVYHEFWSQEGPVSDLGREVDVLFTRKIGPNVLLLAMAGYYFGAGSGAGPDPVHPDTFKLWLEATYAF